MKIPKPYLKYEIIKIIPDYWKRRFYNSLLFGYSKKTGEKLLKCLTDYKERNNIELENDVEYTWDLLNIKKHENNETN